MTVQIKALPATAPEIGSDMPEWYQGAQCASSDPELFFPDKGSSAKAAKLICSGCDFQAECLEWALANNEAYGVWGGLSERERRGMPKKRIRQRVPCGTSSGYRTHYRRKETPCEPCRDAERLRRAITRPGAA